MPEFYIRYSGIGNCYRNNLEKIEAKDLDAAILEAYENAKKDWVNYEGMHGNYDIAQIVEEEGCDEEETQAIQDDNIEFDIDYEVYSKEGLIKELARAEEYLEGNPISRYYRERIVGLLEEINEYDIR